MKNALYILLALIILSCNNDDNIDPNQDPTNTLIIKRIKDVRENNERIFYFDTNGRLDSITDTEALAAYGNILLRYEYSSDDKLVGSYNTFGTEEAFSTLSYTNDNISNYYYSTFGYGTDSPVITTNNTLTYIDNQEESFDQDDLNIEMIFNSNNLEYITQRKSSLINDSNSTWNLTDYEYDSNFNLIESHTTMRFGSPIDLISSFNYDDKKNPIAESMSNYRIQLHFFNSIYPFNMSSNNILSSTNSQGVTSAYDYIYNGDDYPVSVTLTNTSTNEITNTITYTYY